MTASPPPTVSWQSPEPEVGPAPGVAFAPHGERLIAYILDSVIVSVTVIVLVVVGSLALYSGSTVVDGQVTSVNSGAGAAFGLAALIATILGLLYYPFFWARGGQTPGMRPFGLRVVRDADGSRIGWGAALLRVLGMWVAALVFYIGFIWVFIDKRRRGWHDLIAGTVVIKEA
ncbi:MAG: RDD family protein [Chloroflexota bacterium]